MLWRLALPLPLLAAGCGAASGLGVSGSTSGGGGGAGGSTGSSTVTTATGGSTGSSTVTTTTTGGSVGSTYTTCAEGFLGPDGNLYLNTFGVQGGAFLTVVPEGTALAATYTDLNGNKSAFSFEPTTGTSAVLAPSGASLPGFAGMCVWGPGDSQVFPATVTATSGALEYTGSTMFLAFTGTIGPSGTSPCATAPVPADAWIVCGTGAGFPAVGPIGTTIPSFPVGQYTCSTQIGTFGAVGGFKQYVTAGGTGTLTVTQSGVTVTAAYAGDTYASGSLDFTVATPTSAHADPGQSILAPCLVSPNPMGPPPASDPPVPVSVSAGSLVMLNDTTLFLMISGAIQDTQASCPGTLKMGSLVCTKS